MSVAAKLGMYVAGLGVVFGAAFGLGDALRGADNRTEKDPAPASTAPASPHTGHTEDGS